MNRKETTKLLTEILIADKLSDRKYYAKEVTLDYGTTHSKRIDVMQFTPKGVMNVSDIEKGIFTCYEVKSCIDDVYSGNGLNFYGEKNYIVTTMETYKELQADLNDGTFGRYLLAHYPESSHHFGILVPVSRCVDLKDSESVFAAYEDPSPFEGNAADWKLWTAQYCTESVRQRSMTELLFCMLRSKHSYTNS